MDVKQIGNIVDDSEIGFKNPQRGRVYDPDGIAPCLSTMQGGGSRTESVSKECDKARLLRSETGGGDEYSVPGQQDKTRACY